MPSRLPQLIARHRQFLVYLAGGSASALIDVGLMQVLIVAGVNYVAATSAGFIAGLLFNYAFHVNLTFESAASRLSFARYLCVVLINYLSTIGCVSLAVQLTGLAVAGKLVSLPLVAASGFLFGKYWIFKPAAPAVKP
jgi:putative flippase GtrA